MGASDEDEDAEGGDGTMAVTVFCRSGGVYAAPVSKHGDTLKPVAEKRVDKTTLPLSLADFRKLRGGCDARTAVFGDYDGFVDKETFDSTVRRLLEFAAGRVKVKVGKELNKLRLFTPTRSYYYMDMKEIRTNEDLFNLVQTSAKEIAHLGQDSATVASLVVVVSAQKPLSAEVKKVSAHAMQDKKCLGLGHVVKRRGPAGSEAAVRDMAWKEGEAFGRAKPSKHRRRFSVYQKSMSDARTEPDDEELDDYTDTLSSTAEAKGAFGRIVPRVYAFQSLSATQLELLWDFFVEQHDSVESAMKSLDKQIKDAADDNEDGVGKLMCKSGGDFLDPATKLGPCQEYFEMRGKVPFPRKLNKRPRRGSDEDDSDEDDDTDAREERQIRLANMRLLSVVTNRMLGAGGAASGAGPAAPVQTAASAVAAHNDHIVEVERQQTLAEARLAKLEVQLKGETDAAEEEVLKNRIKDLKKKIRERERTIDGLY